jgi:ubiquinone/menaquinone biosynthesis C-methylase UbiE
MKGRNAEAYDKRTQAREKRFMGALRSEMLKDVTGNVLEIGAGTGLNFPHYRNGATVAATEPDPGMLAGARKRSAEAAAQIEVQQASAEELPFPDATFDFAVSTLVLCGVNDPAKALAEIWRVLKPGGELRVYEHIRYKNPIGALSQDVINLAGPLIGARCHPNRDTERHLREAGFELNDVQVRHEAPLFSPKIVVRPHLQAVARRPA